MTAATATAPKPTPAKVAGGTKGPYSHSGLSCYKTCALQHLLSRIKRIPTAETEPQVAGKLAHEAAARYVQHLVKTKQSSDTDAFDVIVEETVAKVPTGMSEGFVADTLRRFIEGFYFEPADGEEVLTEMLLAVDRKFEPIAFDSPDAYFRGVIDLAYVNRKKKTARIIDYKTGYSMSRDPEQPRRYAMLINRHFGIEAVEVSFFFVRHGIFTPPEVLTIEEIRATARRVNVEVRRVEADKAFKASPGPQCSGCAYAGTKHCPVDLSAVEPIRNEKDARRTIGEIERISGALSRLKSNAAVWCSANGMIQYESVEWGHIPTQDTSVKVLPFAALVKSELGEEFLPELYEHLALRKTKKAVRFVDRFREALIEIKALIVKPKTTFKRHRTDTIKNGDDGDGEDE